MIAQLHAAHTELAAQQAETQRQADAQAREYAVQQQEVSRRRIWELCTCPTGLAFFTGLVVMLVLWIMNPPMVQMGGKSNLEKQQPCGLKIVMWGAAAAAVVGLSPVFFRAMLS